MNSAVNYVLNTLTVAKARWENNKAEKAQERKWEREHSKSVDEFPALLKRRNGKVK